MFRTAIAAEWLFPVTSPALRGHSLEVEEGVITAIRPSKKNDRFVQNACILPGFVNAHTHLAYTFFRNRFDHLDFFPWIRQLTEEKKNWTEADIAASTRQGIAECLRAGITCVADMSDMEPSLKQFAASPLRGIFYWEVFGVEQAQAELSLNFLLNEFQKKRKNYASERLQLGVSPHSCYTVRPELFANIADWAKKEQVPVSFHIAESKAEEEFIRDRKGIISDFLKTRVSDWQIDSPSSVTHLEKTGILGVRPLVAHGVQVSPKDIGILRKHNVPIAHCPKSNAKFGHGIAPLADFLSSGLTVGLGTDSAASNNRLDLFEEARFALLQARASSGRKILDERKILEMLTIDGAKAMGLEKQIGSLETGKKADFIIVRLPFQYQDAPQVLSHLVYTSVADDVLASFIGGKEINLQNLEPIE